MTGSRNRIGTGQAGLVGKVVAIWLLIAAVLAVGVLDAISIGRTTLHVSEIAIETASDGATAFRIDGRSVTKACGAVTASIETLDPSLKLGRNGCVVDTATGRVTVTLKATADTIIAGRFGPTADYTEIVVRESSGPSNV